MDKITDAESYLLFTAAIQLLTAYVLGSFDLATLGFSTIAAWGAGRLIAEYIYKI